MLIGEYRCALDDKGRLSFPAKFREELGEEFYVSRWLDDCLIAFSPADWERVEESLAEKSLAKGRKIRRFLYANACEAHPDKQGRILLTAPLREKAKLERDIVVIGVGRHAEIWDAATYNAMAESLNSEAVEEAMDELDF